MNSIRKLLVVLLLLTAISLSTLLHAETINVKTSACNYKIIIPTGWDTIPTDTIRLILKNDLINIGIYKKNNDYFTGGFIQYIFIPTVKSLNQFSFSQITEDIQNGLDKIIKKSKNSKIVLKYDNFFADKEKKACYISGKTLYNQKVRKFKQIFIATKFGFLKIIYQESITQNTNSLTFNNLFATINLNNNYKYTEPEPRTRLSIWNILIAFIIGISVYLIILQAPKIKQALNKNSL